MDFGCIRRNLYKFGRKGYGYSPPDRVHYDQSPVREQTGSVPDGERIGYDYQKPALVILAAGMGSRFGGLKQLTPVGPGGEMIIDYSIHDAIRAGFGKIVFVIKHEIEEEFKEKIGRRTEAKIPVSYVYQELDRLPEGYTVPEGRVKPWGTGHAVLCCRGVVDGPFMVINADDFYGPNCYRLLAEFLDRPQSDSAKLHIAMAAFTLENTLTENGSVSRGICSVDENGRLTGLVERTRIEWRDGRAMFSEDGGETWTALPEGCPVSMNCWAFPAGALDKFTDKFREFLDRSGRELKSEFFLPFAVDEMVEKGEADVQVLHSTDKWYGMTYAADRQMVIDAIARMIGEGVYPERL